jgi:hypothetical protein
MLNATRNLTHSSQNGKIYSMRSNPVQIIWEKEMARILSLIAVFSLCSAPAAFGEDGLWAQCEDDLAQITFRITGTPELAEMDSLIVVANYLGSCNPPIILPSSAFEIPGVGETIDHDLVVPNPEPGWGFNYELLAVDAQGAHHQIPPYQSGQYGVRPYAFPAGCGEVVMARGAPVLSPEWFVLCEDHCWVEFDYWQYTGAMDRKDNPVFNCYGYFSYDNMPGAAGLNFYITRTELVEDGGCDAVSLEKPTFGGLKSYYR